MTDEIQNSTVIILAGGFGTRLQSVVKDVPKPMALINGKPFLEFQLSFLERSGIQNVVLATGYKSEVIKRYFNFGFSSMNVQFSDEVAPLGTGGGLIKAARLVDSERQLFVLNGDTFFPISLADMLAAHREKNADVTIAMMESMELGRYSSFDIGSDGQLSLGSDQSSIYKSGGVYLLSPNVIADLQSRNVEKLSFEDDLTPSYLSAKMRMFAYFSKAPFVDIGVPYDYLRAGDVIEQYEKD